MKLVPPLLSWFARNARDLPWRRTRDPYAIWVSEIMLQQTQVKTVIPYWERWMRGLPTIRALARAKPEKVLKLWEGLGYYTRARNLQQAAKLIVQRHGGAFPTTFDEVLALPGIGRYTAGAICSIAFNQPKPILDGNVIRVLTRVFGIPENPRGTKTNALLWQLAGELVHHASRITHHASACSHLNQSLMELGAVICTPRQPKCHECPVAQNCWARRHNRTEQIPGLGKRAASTARHFVAFVIKHNNRFLVRQRPAGVVNAHLWEFPNAEIASSSRSRGRQFAQISPGDVPHRLRSAAATINLGFKLAVTKPLCTIKHSITRYRIILDAFYLKIARNGQPEGRVTRVPNLQKRNGTRTARPAGKWLPLETLDSLPFTSAHKKILQRLEQLQ